MSLLNGTLAELPRALDLKSLLKDLGLYVNESGPRP